MPVNPALSGKQYFIVTLGCFRNEVESDMLRSALADLGMSETASLEAADAVLVNTCGFIREACEEGVDTILELDSLVSGSGKRPTMIVVGCMGERYGMGLLEAMPEVDNVLGVGWQAGLEKALLQGHAAETVSGSGTPRAGSVSLTGSGRTVDSSPGASMFVRVADGCDRACAFCTIPAIRGPYRSRPSSEVVDEIRRLSGGRQLEVILLAQDLSSYGIDLADRSRLPSLIDEVCSLDEVRWLRLLYLQPEGVDRALLDAIERNPKVCRYFDIPFQHASESVLERMGRPGDARSHAAIVESIRSRFPEAAVRTTVMVGYPGETEEEFAELERFVEDLRFDWMGAFRYSSEENTPAAGLGREVPDEVAAERYGRILDIQDFIEAERGAFFAGRELEVVVDGVSEEEGYDLVGRSYREAPVVDGVIYLRAPGVTLSAGEFVRAVVTAQEGLDLVGEVRGTGERGASRD